MQKGLYLFLMLSLLLTTLTGCEMSKEEYTIEEKVTQEIKYMENELVGIVNKFVLNSYAETEKEEGRNDNTEVNVALDGDGENVENRANDNSLARNQFNYEALQEDNRKIEKSSNRIMVDLAAANVENAEITKLSDGIGKMTIALENNDEITYLAELNNIFALFPNYEAKISNNSDDIFERRLKYFTISTYIAFSLR